MKDQRETQIMEASFNVRATIEKVRLETVQAYVGYQQAQQAFGLAERHGPGPQRRGERTERLPPASPQRKPRQPNQNWN